MTDKLAHVKAFFVSVSLDGFGVRRFMAPEKLDPARKYMQEHAVQLLYLAIVEDDPDYNPTRDPTNAKTTTAVRAYVAEAERDRQFLQRYDPYGELYHLMFAPGQEGCFLGGLIEALQADDPDWRPNE